MIAWTLGEYAYLVNDETPLPEVAVKLCELAKRQFSEPNTRGCVMICAVTYSGMATQGHRDDAPDGRTHPRRNDCPPDPAHVPGRYPTHMLLGC